MPPSEEARLGALHGLGILDTPPEPELDDLVRLAATLCGTPISFLSFVDETRTWLKASVGLNAQEAPREITMCHYTVQQSTLLEVEDLRADPRFCDSPLVTSTGGLRFYAGLPLDLREGCAVGSLCVCDFVPRCLLPEQHKALTILADQIRVRLQLRAQHRTLKEALWEAHTARAKAELIERRFQTFMDSGPFLAYIKDAQGRMLYYNEPLAKQFHVSRTELLTKTDADLWPARLAAEYRSHDEEVLRTGTLQVRYEETLDPDGTTSVWRSYKFPCSDEEGQMLLCGVSVNATEERRHQEEVQRYQAELEEANRRLRALASLDALTALSNRRIFDEELRKAFREARQSGTALSVLLLDVDRFKQHNDRFGHSHGDQVLRELGSCLKSNLRMSDLLARYGGEEFAVLLPATTAAEAKPLAMRLLEAVRQKHWPLAPVTVSIGVSTLNPATRDTQHLLGRADEALYAAKCKGRDQVVSYTDEIRGFGLPPATGMCE